ncbi:MAG TPA: dihydrofolate reductase [Candidatus Avirikenella pullistercoris]|nr:dihydrofolate reductase [Candidatus Avirikenella pullistercoris]
MAYCRKMEKNMDKTDFKWQADRFDDIKVLRYQVPGFEKLTLRQKKLAYYLSEAALCGRDILFDQNFKYNLRIRKVLEAVYKEYKGDRSVPEFAAFEKYLKKVWFANGIHHHYSNEKFQPEFSENYFRELVGAVPSLQHEKEDVLGLIPVLFDKELYALRVSQEQEGDMVVASANNYYEGVTQCEVEQFYGSMLSPDDREPVSVGLNSKLVKEDGKLKEKVWKVGGMYSPAIEKIVYWLEKAVEAAENDRQKAVIEALVDYYRSGDLKEFDRYNILWVADTESFVDFLNGFIETYGDPMGYKASWEATVNFKNEEATRRTEIISANAQWFEDHSPIDVQYRKKKVKGVSAKVITMVQLGGDCYPATPIGINLPNSDWIRKEYGSKSVTIQNITSAYAHASEGDGFMEEFILREEDKELLKTYGVLADDLHTDLHECLGHGSGQLAPGIKGDELKNYASPLEEARADLFALYFIGDAKMMELGIVPNMEVMKASYNKTMFNGLIGQLTRIEYGKDIVQAHMRDRQLIAAWCYEKGKADNVVEIVKKDGKSYVVVNDYERLRGLFGELLKEIQRIKSEGDFEAGKNLIETYGVKVNRVIHKEVLERYAALDLAPYSGFINPVLVPVFDRQGEMTDVKIEYPENYMEQMLGYSENYSFL